MGFLDRFDGGKRLLESIIAPLVIDGRIAGPDALENVEIFGGALVALIVIQIVAIAALLGVVASRDDVHGDATAAEVIERGERARCQRRGYEARPMSQQHPQPMGIAEDL